MIQWTVAITIKDIIRIVNWSIKNRKAIYLTIKALLQLAYVLIEDILDHLSVKTLILWPKTLLKFSPVQNNDPFLLNIDWCELLVDQSEIVDD